jgi:hypothetical protein
MLETPKLAAVLPVERETERARVEPTDDAAQIPFVPARSIRARGDAAAPRKKPVRLVHMGAVSLLLGDRLPMADADIAALLVEQGVVPAPLDLPALARLYRAGGHEVPFQIIRCGGMAIAVDKGTGPLATQIGSTAIRMALYWGLASVRAVAERASAMTSSAVSEETAHRLLAAMPRVRWLDDERRRWFTVTGEAGRLEQAIRKIFAVAPAVPLDELRAALARALPGAHEAPRRIFSRCLVELGFGAIDADGAQGEVVRRADGAEPHDPTALTPQEARMVELLAEAGGRQNATLLRQRGLAARIPKTTINQMLRQSPLFAPVEPSDIRLVGRAAEKTAT